MKLMTALEPGTDISAWGAAVHEMIDCFSAGDSMYETMENARQAIEQHVKNRIAKIAAMSKDKVIGAAARTIKHNGVCVWVYLGYIIKSPKNILLKIFTKKNHYA